MKNNSSRVNSSPPTRPSNKIKISLWSKLVKPHAAITGAIEQRQVRLISAMLLVLTMTMISGVIYMGFFNSNTPVAFVLAGADMCIGIAYFISRTRHYHLAALIGLIILFIIPILNVGFSVDFSSEALLILLIWNSLTILLSSAMMPQRYTRIFAVINVLTLLLLPVFFPKVLFKNIALPIIFNAVISTSILVFAQHRNSMENDRLMEITQTKELLQVELSERQRIEEQLVYTALHDPLTDLPNRVLFMDRLNHAMERAKRNKNFLFAVLFLDLDRFKVVNDSQGHAIGDLLLIESGRRLKDCIRAEDTAARLGGDEFVVLLEDLKDPHDFLHAANRILNNLAQPAYLDGQKVFVSISMGVVLNDARYKLPEEILRDADIAMYRAKSLGRSRYEIFDPEMLDTVMARLELETELWKALENHEFIVYYQPILNLKTRQIIGVEALLRWQHPTRGLLLPADFIPTAEEIGLIVPAGYWVLEEACRQIRTWQEQFPADPPLTVSVNLSTRQCTQPDLVEKISEILQKYNLDSSSLKLELTESLIIEDSETISAMLQKLRNLGIQVQIDDFGTGYSSLSYLHSLPIDTLKIDRTFISRLGDNDSGIEIVRTILALAHNLGMKVVAEGVETNVQLSALQELDCEFVQGFLFARPVGSQDATALLEKSLSEAKN